MYMYKLTSNGSTERLKSSSRLTIAEIKFCLDQDLNLRSLAFHVSMYFVLGLDGATGSLYKLDFKLT
jgi:hypothetical protein